jgi:predicted phosphodiesterase
LVFLGLAAVALATVSGAGCNGGRETSASPDARSIGDAPLAAEVRAREATLPPPEAVNTPAGTFLARPYLQMGSFAAPTGETESLQLLWQAPVNRNAEVWAVETRPAGSEAWVKSAAVPEEREVAVPGVDAHKVWSVPLTGLAPGALFDYRVSKDGASVFAARARARRAATEPHRFVAVGDTGAGNDAERKIVYQMSLAKPDFIFVTGDIVYERGRSSEYQKNFFPVYNAETASPATGAPLLRSTLTLAAPGNHDTGYRNLGKYPDGLAYFMYWSQPLNGPALAAGAANTPTLLGPGARQPAFLAASGAAYPRMANFSFDYGGAHWTVLDSNPYVNWSDPALAAWVAADLAAAKDAKWRFVSFHHPPFSSAQRHSEAQQMRVLSPVFEKGKVDIVWNGHVHNYQRSYPLRFTVTRGKDGVIRDPDGRVDGDFAIDKTFDGKTQTKPNGIIYVVTGGGGAGLYDTGIENAPKTWLPFTAKYVGAHSFTVVDVEDSRLTVSQIDGSGKERDHFVVTR